ncbi:MAG TPA: IS110 family transposase [Candidatus Binataceae bacterium]|nr:IS110 family transposase [Candidatus Binataceae bacterium]
MKDHSEAFVAFDTSKLRNAVAIAEGGRRGEVRFLGEIDNSPEATAKLVRKLAGKYQRVTFCYEAGPTGYGLYRQISRMGHTCLVVAPSLIPKRPGDRVKTNRRDALSLARQLRAGELTAVWVPDPRHEAMRDLTRARGAAVADLRSKRQQASGFLLRLGRHFAGKKTWTKAHMTWLASQKLEHAEQRIAFEEMLLAIRQAQERVARLEEAIRTAVPEWSLAQVVEALMAMRGIDMVAATAFLAEIGNLSRFQTPRELMGYLGLVPSEQSTGDTIRRGPITKAGNRRARRVLVESAWSYRHPPRVGKDKQAKVAAAPPAVRAIAWKAQHRLYGRYRALVRKGKLKTVAITAIARELAGFIWAVSRELTMTASVAAR